MRIAREFEVTGGVPCVVTLTTGQTLRLTARSVISFVCFNVVDVNERFDQARTKVYNMKVWAGTGDRLFSKQNNPMMTLAEDGFAGEARHDLQFGFGAAARLTGLPERPDVRLALAEALAPWSIQPAAIPSPLNLLHQPGIDMASGALRPSALRPAAPVAMDLIAEMDLVAAAIQETDPAVPGTLAFRVTVLAP